MQSLTDALTRVDHAQDVILAVDPGTTTGLALWLQLDQPHLKCTAQVGAVDACQAADVVLDLPYATIVVERFDVGQKFVRSKRNYDALYVIGYLRFKCEIELCPFIELGRSDTKTLLDDRKLKALGWYEPGRRHSNDALRVLGAHLLDVDPEFPGVVRSALDGTR